MYRVVMPIAALAFAAIVTSPAIAAPQSAISIPEPTDVLLFVMGAAGVAIGRRMHARAARRDRIRDDSAPDQPD